MSCFLQTTVQNPKITFTIINRKAATLNIWKAAFFCRNLDAKSLMINVDMFIISAIKCTLLLSTSGIWSIISSENDNCKWPQRDGEGRTVVGGNDLWKCQQCSVKAMWKHTHTHTYMLSISSSHIQLYSWGRLSLTVSLIRSILLKRTRLLIPSFCLLLPYFLISSLSLTPHVSALMVFPVGLEVWR